MTVLEGEAKVRGVTNVWMPRSQSKTAEVAPGGSNFGLECLIGF